MSNTQTNTQNNENSLKNTQNTFKNTENNQLNNQFNNKFPIKEVILARRDVRVSDIRLTTLLGNPNDGIGFINLSSGWKR